MTKLLLSICIALLGSTPLAQLIAAEEPGAPATSDVTPAATPAPAATVDKAAQQFMQSCRGCHTIGGGALTGPDLAAVVSWKRSDLTAAIKRMEKHVGPMTDDEINGLADLLSDSKAPARLQAAEAAVAKAFAAKLEPASAVIGKELFFGRKAFVNDGMACSACHEVKGNGGLLGPDLTGIYAKMGETPLVSAIEKSSFKVMSAAYRAHPVTRQEAMHLAKFLSTVANEPQVARAPVWPLGAAGAGLFFVGLIAWKRHVGSGHRPQLQRRRQ